MPKFIFVTGGVLSGVGKGITAAAVGSLLKSSGFSVFIAKVDPYLNIDPGTMSPYQHGEVFVTEDGAETDLDLGHYERFIDVAITKSSSIISGRLYTELIEAERRGDFLGHTVQVIPHLTNLAKDKIYQAAEESGCEIMVVELGGTVGDIEGEYAFETFRQMRHELGFKNSLFIHVGYLPYLETSKEIKTKPMQASVRELRGRGIQADMIFARADHKITKSITKKLSCFCDVPLEAVIPAPTVSSIYEIPLNFHKAGVLDVIVDRLKLKKIPGHSRIKVNIDEWKKLNRKIKNVTKEVRIGLVGKYVQNGDSYISVCEALAAAGYAQGHRIKIISINPEWLEKGNEKTIAKMKKCDGLVVPGGFGKRGIEGKIIAARHCREKKIPYLGLCLGSQIMAIEFARHILKTDDVNSEEFDAKTKHPVVHIMEHQKIIKKKGGTMRLGLYDCKLNPKSKSYKLYGKKKIAERHRHRYEFNNEYRTLLEDNGFVFGGTSPDNLLVEIVELKDHPFMIGSQFHPEFPSRPTCPHPLFQGFIKAVIKTK